MLVQRSKSATLKDLLASTSSGFKIHKTDSGLLCQIELHLSGELVDLGAERQHTKVTYTNIIDIHGCTKKIPCLEDSPSIETRLEAACSSLRAAEKAQCERLGTFWDSEVLCIARLASKLIEANTARIAPNVAELLKLLGIIENERRVEVVVQRKSDYPTYEQFPEWSSLYVQTRHGSKRLIEEHTEELLRWGRRPYTLIG